jgi:hypothetical protein
VPLTQSKHNARRREYVGADGSSSYELDPRSILLILAVVVVACQSGINGFVRYVAQALTVMIRECQCVCCASGEARPKPARPVAAVPEPMSEGNHRASRYSGIARRYYWAWLACAAMYSGIAAKASNAQQHRVTRWEVECRTCIASLTRGVTMGDEAGPGTIGHPGKVVRDSRGRFYFAHYKRIDGVAVFDSGGKYLQTISFPRVAAGSLRNILVLAVGKGDSLFVFDNGANKCLVLSPDYRVARSFDLPGSIRDAVVLSDGSLVVNAIARTPDLIGLPLHFLRSDGSYSHSFGTQDAVFRPDAESYSLRLLAHAREGVWTVAVSQYAIQRWNKWTMVPQEAFAVKADWFEPWLHERSLSKDGIQGARVTAVQTDNSGLLWIAIAVPDKSWRKGLHEIETVDGKVTVPADFERVFDTRIEVWDPERRKLLASTLVDAFVIGFADKATAVSFRGGYVLPAKLDSWRIAISTSPSPR